jgi:2-polyprenyl-3-methyl-5-hydroxy-6-metoxy-1,4-benzoquinol methylase
MVSSASLRMNAPRPRRPESRIREPREPDFRRELYQRYVSTFKNGQVQGGSPNPDSRVPIPGAERASYWSWCERKYLPLLSGLGRDEPVLELGCGPGHLMEFLQRRGFSHVTGIDISEEQAWLARARGQLVCVADALPFLESNVGRFAAIIAVDFLEHFTRDELMTLVKQIATALRQGGVLMVQTANGQGLFPNQVIYGDLTHMTIFTPGSLGQLLRAHGFGQPTFYETGPVAVRLHGRANVALWGGITGAARLVRQVETGKRQDIWTENFICRAVKS